MTPNAPSFLPNFVDTLDESKHVFEPLKLIAIENKNLLLGEFCLVIYLGMYLPKIHIITYATVAAAHVWQWLSKNLLGPKPYFQPHDK